MAKPEQWVAALPMYNVSASLRADWVTLIERVAQSLQRTGVALTAVDPGDDAAALHAFWRREDMLLSQACGYPLVQGLAPHVRLIGTPRFRVPGCQWHTYRSAIVVRAGEGPDTLAACRGARAACNAPDSHSGMNALRHAVAPLARAGRFFGEVIHTGSHLASLAAVTAGEADVAAIDCVTLAYAAEHHPELVAGVRQIGATRAVAGLPFIASRRAGAPLVHRVRAAMRQALHDDAALRVRLRLEDVVPSAVADYQPVSGMALEAGLRGYGALN
ncbi:phosphate/phosphite/phosphonate ABC transporter substrate-binding protein [Cupriavidus oxalaticus]|uniref:phosphate/phosphite/phosphonate ABC transporter substrate-binding protein n=1 Tax=Cupriavidus oxalaticus TaxID=96344 RepID=UPI004034E2E0